MDSLFGFLNKVYNSRQVVTVSVEPYASGMSAKIVAFVLSFLLEQIVSAEYFVPEVFQRLAVYLAWHEVKGFHVGRI